MTRIILIEVILHLQSNELHPHPGRSYSDFDIFLLILTEILSFLDVIHLLALQWHARFKKWQRQFMDEIFM